MDEIQIASMASLPLSFAAIYVAAKRWIKERDTFSGIILFAAVFFSATLISSCFRSKLFIDFISSPEISMDISVNPRIVAFALFAAAVIIASALFLIARHTQRNNILKTLVILLLVFVMANLLAGICGSLLFNFSLDKGFFYSCCATMGISGLAWGLTYEEICVIGNIYMQLAILLWSALFVAYSAVRRYRSNATPANRFIMICGYGYGLIYCVFAACVISHYAMPLHDAFYLCVNELVVLANQYNSTYKIVNYVIFIIGFLILTIGNILLAVWLRPKEEKADGEEEEINPLNRTNSNSPCKTSV